MNYLLDTNVISEFAKQTPDPHVVAWLRRHADANLHLSVITIGEIQQGVARLPTSQRKADLAAWLRDTLLAAYASLIIPLDTATLLRWGTLTGDLLRTGRPLPVMDGLIAATALEHDLTLVTRNVGDFAGAGVPLLNPWAS